MHWLLVGAAALVGVVLAVVGIGAALPRDHVAARAARLSAPPERVWALLTDVAAYPRWRGDVTAVELLPPRDGRVAWRETSRHGRITFERVDAEPPHRLITRIVDDGLPFGGQWEYDLAPDGDGTRLVVTERGAVYNPLFMSRFVFGHTATLDAYLRALGGALGTETVPADAPIADPSSVPTTERAEAARGA